MNNPKQCINAVAHIKVHYPPLYSPGSYTHDAISAHTDVIKDISCCEKLQLFVSCSADTTVRLWNEDNILLRYVITEANCTNTALYRVIHIGGIPSCITVSSECADLVLAVNETLYGISHSTCQFEGVCVVCIYIRICINVRICAPLLTDLPNACMLRLVGMRCVSPVEQSPLPYHTELGSLPPSDAARLEKVQQNKER